MAIVRNIISLLILWPSVLLGQNTLSLAPQFGNAKLSLDSTYTASNGDTIHIETFKFYLSKITLMGNQKKHILSQAHLVDLGVDSTLTLGNLPKNGGYHSLEFYLGIDSVTNTSGALGGDLDPSLGMYWTWQSGYINLKLEGSNSANTSRNQTFQYHLGGYLPPHYALQKITLPIESGQDITIILDLAPLFESGSLKETSQIMSPSAKAAALSAQIASLFSIAK